MPDFYEIDFLDVEADSSGDAIALRYEIAGQRQVHLVDGGYQATGPKIVNHINRYYETNRIDHLVVTHCDRDHTGGLAHVLENMEVGALWLHRPWLYAEVLLPYFNTYTSVDRLRARLRSIYSSLASLEAIASARGVPMCEPFQGQRIGAFTVLAPSRERYLRLVLQSDRTPETVEEAEATASDRAHWLLLEATRRLVNLIRSAWGHEIFSPSGTSAENEMSVVQFARLSDSSVVLTGDAGREALAEAAEFAPQVGLMLPGVSNFQIPHHGSRRNVSTELLDRWLGTRLPNPVVSGQERGLAVVSSALADTSHPRNAVVRAFMHRGMRVIKTESRSICVWRGAPPMRGWGPVESCEYPTSQEE